MAHFLEECTSWHFFEGKELDFKELEKKAFLLTLKQNIPALMETPIWHGKDRGGFWFCPFCLNKTKISLQKKDRQILNSPEEFFSHLESCTPFINRRGEPYSEVEVRESLDRYNKNSEIHSLKHKVLSEPEWQVLDNQSHWHCPYCLIQTEIVLVRGKISPEQLQKIYTHLSICSQYRGGKGLLQTPDKIREILLQSNQKNQYKKLYESITSDTVWQLLTEERAWFCPFCASSTEIKVENFKWEEALPKISEHLSECQHKKFSREPRPFEEVRGKLQIHNKKRKILPLLQEKMKDPLFRCTLKSEGWVCPYCQEPQSHILLIGDANLNLQEIAEHLSAQCPAYELGKLPQITLEDLKKSFQKKVAQSTPSAPVVPPSQTPPRAVEKDTFTRRRKLQKEKMENFREEQKKLVRSLEDARQKQLKMLPDIPKIKGLEFQCFFKPCEHIGGDFYDIVPMENNRLGLTIGDVSGHGIEAALLVGMAKKLLEVHGKASSSPVEVLYRTHEDMIGDLDGKTFITVLYAHLDYEKKILRVANAGHPPLILCNPQRPEPVQKIYVEGMALGLGKSEFFLDTLQEAEVELMPGDVIFLYTDGILEAKGKEDHFFGEERLEALLEKYGKYELEYMLYKVEKALSTFQGREKQRDDETILSFQIQ